MAPSVVTENENPHPHSGKIETKKMCLFPHFHVGARAPPPHLDDMGAWHRKNSEYRILDFLRAHAFRRRADNIDVVFYDVYCLPVLRSETLVFVWRVVCSFIAGVRAYSWASSDNSTRSMLEVTKILRILRSTGVCSYSVLPQGVFRSTP
jgi:hypothetical protein